MTSTYATQAELVRFLKIDKSVPELQTSGVDRPDETVGTGDNNTLVFYLDHAYIIPSTYSLYYGATAGVGTALTETTHYTLNKDSGVLTLTVAGRTAIGTSNIYASYKYNSLELTSEQMQEALDRAQEDIDSNTDAHWATGTDITPDWGVITDEKHRGQGMYARDYYLLKYPLPSIHTEIAGTALAVSDTTVWVTSTAGFPTAGVIGVGQNKVTYTSKDATSFTGCSGVTVAAAVDTEVHPHVFELSTTDAGSDPTWTVLEPDTGFDLDYEAGRVHVYKDDYQLDPYGSANPPKIPNRFRASYLFGYDEIDADIKHLCLMIAAKHLLHTVARKTLLTQSGKGGLDMVNLGIDDKWIEEELRRHKSLRLTAL